ncbi:MAG: DUF4177 domain-containing protein [Chloroflexota bacterium]|nr:MAG: DUF4177 domain-containing protein [Chloroflexota bacterium]
MQKWDYLNVTVGPTRKGGFVAIELSKKIPGIEEAEILPKVLDKLGSEGWELVGIVPTLTSIGAVFGGYEGGLQRFELFFKRPRE